MIGEDLILERISARAVMVLGRTAMRHRLALEALGAGEPALGHPVPGRLALRIARELGHLLAIGGVSQKFIRRIHHGHDAHFVVPGATTR